MLNKAYIDLNQLIKNAQAIKKKIKNGDKFCAVVKADAYGHGAEKIANAIYRECDMFAVALIEEAIKLRLSGIDKDILILSPTFENDIDQAIRYDLTISVDNIKSAKKIQQRAMLQNKRAKIHIKFNSGMNRLGVDSLRELNFLAKEISLSKNLYLDGMFSHLGNIENKVDTLKAQNKFLLANNLIKGYNNKADCHLASSGGFLSGIKSDIYRIGIMLYGYKPFESDYVSIKPIMKIYAPLIKKRQIKKGEHCLYGKARAKNDMEIALVRYGYADGLFRKESLGQFNNMCMDISALSQYKITKKGILIMDNAAELAKKYNTISYEILTKSAIRAEKIYIN